MIAVDAMGGDFAPSVVVEGALDFVKSTGNKVCLFGPEVELTNCLCSFDSSWVKYPIVISDAKEKIEMGEEPVRAIRSKKDSSLVKAIASVCDGTCSAVVSAGNSGAVMAASLFLVGRNNGVDRPALVGFLPGIKGPVVCLDLGANVDCKASNLYQFARLGERYAAEMLGIHEPKIGLLSVGEEDSKGSLLTKESFALLKRDCCNFVGNVEPFHLFKNDVDVVVCDGFTGNVLLKTLESVGAVCCKLVGQENQDVSQALSKRLHEYDQGGALLLGVRKPVIISHGSASMKSISKAILFAHKIISKITVGTYDVKN